MNRIAAFSRKIFQSKLLENYVFLSIYQVVNFAVPLIIVPFIIKYVGIKNYGNIAFSYAFVNYFSVLTDYGFNLSATRSISIHRNDSNKVNSIYSTVMLTKLLFFIAALVVFCSLLFTPFFKEYFLLHLGSFALVLAQVLMPVWLFQGLEDMKYLAISNTVSKLLFAAFIIFFIRRQDDFVYVNLLQGIGGIIASLICHILILTKLKIKIVKVGWAEIVHEIKDGWMLFLSSFAVNIYVNSNAFILGLFASPVQLGYYSIAEKVYFALKQFGNVFSQVIFPQVCLLANQSMELLKKFQRKVFVPFLLFLTIVCLTVFLLAEQICMYFTRAVDANEVLLIRIFCIVPIIVAFDIPAFQALLAMNKKKQYGITLVAGCVLNIILNVLLVQFFGAVGTTIAVLTTELFVTISLIVNFNKAASDYTTLVPSV